MKWKPIKGDRLALILEELERIKSEGSNEKKIKKAEGNVLLSEKDALTKLAEKGQNIYTVDVSWKKNSDS